MNSPIVTTADLTTPRQALSPIAIGLVVALTTFAFTWTVLAWPTILVNLKWAAGVSLGDAAPIAAGAALPAVAENHLLIPKLGIEAPLVFDVPTDDAVGRLPDGVVHVAETVRPGQIGTSVLVGHSAGYWWQQGDYNQVFALLDKLTVDDEIFVNVSGTTYHYRMTGRRIVHPSQVDVLTQSSTEKELVLMTCNPVGTTLNRLLIDARIVE